MSVTTLFHFPSSIINFLFRQSWTKYIGTGMKDFLPIPLLTMLVLLFLSQQKVEEPTLYRGTGYLNTCSKYFVHDCLRDGPHLAVYCLTLNFRNICDLKVIIRVHCYLVSNNFYQSLKLWRYTVNSSQLTDMGYRN